MTIQARLETVENADRRASPRRMLRLGSVLASAGHEVKIHNLSTTGVLLQTIAQLEPFDELEVDLPEIGATKAYVVWNSGDYFGCEFIKPISKAAISAAMLRNPIVEPALPDPTPAAVKDIDAEDEDAVASDELSFAVKMRVILGTSIALWALILWAVGVI